MRLTFEAWILRVEQLLVARCGLGVDDLPDCDYKICYTAGVTPASMAASALDNARYDF